MDKDVKGKRVPKWMITDPMKRWLRKYSGLKKIEEALRRENAVQETKALGLRNLGDSLRNSYQELMQNVPQEQLYDLEGMNLRSKAIQKYVKSNLIGSCNNKLDLAKLADKIQRIHTPEEILYIATLYYNNAIEHMIVKTAIKSFRK